MAEAHSWKDPVRLPESSSRQVLGFNSSWAPAEASAGLKSPPAFAEGRVGTTRALGVFSVLDVFFRAQDARPAFCFGWSSWNLGDPGLRDLRVARVVGLDYGWKQRVQGAFRRTALRSQVCCKSYICAGLSLLRTTKCSES